MRTMKTDDFGEDKFMAECRQLLEDAEVVQRKADDLLGQSIAIGKRLQMNIHAAAEKMELSIDRLFDSDFYEHDKTGKKIFDAINKARENTSISDSEMSQWLSEFIEIKRCAFEDCNKRFPTLKKLPRHFHSDECRIRHNNRKRKFVD